MTSETVDRVLDTPVHRHRMPDRNFRLWLVFPAVLLLLLIGLFPLIYSLVISFQNLTMLDQDTSFHGLMNYAQLFRDRRLWEAILHTLLITAVALPLELVLGLVMAQLFLDHMPGRQLFIALIVLSALQPWLHKLGIGRMPGDFRFRIGKREILLPFTSTLLLTVLMFLIARFI